MFKNEGKKVTDGFSKKTITSFQPLTVVVCNYILTKLTLIEKILFHKS